MFIHIINHLMPGKSQNLESFNGQVEKTIFSTFCKCFYLIFLSILQVSTESEIRERAHHVLPPNL